MKTKFSQRVLSVLLCIAIIMTCLPFSVLAASASQNNSVAISDPGTADAWEDIMGTTSDGNRYAGRVWVDKSVYTDGDTVKLNRDGNEDSQFVVDVDEANGEYFQVVFSALGSSMSTNTQIYATRPLDVVLVLDTSTSMATNSGGRTRFQHMIEAANDLLEELVALGDVRIAIVSFNADSETIIGLNKYDNGVVLSVNNYSNRTGNGVITARDNNGRQLGNDSGYTSGTNLQDGIDRGMNILANAENTEGRAPVAIVLADGRANRAVGEEWYAPTSSNRQSSGDAGIMLSTLLNAAYGRTRVEKNYGTDMTVYGIGIDLDDDSDDYIFLNPGAEGTSGFNESNNSSSVKSAWNAFNTWKRGTTARISSGWSSFTFDHAWPTSEGITTAEIAANINYVDDYQNSSSANLGSAFDEILQELSIGAFNPITSTKDVVTGVEDTPLIYVDNIGKYMEVKNIQMLQVFGQTFNIVKNTDGTYSIADGSGVNPTTNENWSTSGDIDINLLYNDDGTQQLRIYIDQEILPILLDKITVTTENGSTTRTLEEYSYPPLRIYYTVGIDNDILLPNGEINPTKIDSDYEFLNADGTASFYSNAFGVMSKVDADNDGLVDEGDAHVGFIPSHENRYYYHQSHQDVYIDVQTSAGGIVWEDDMYGFKLEEGDYSLTKMTYADLVTIQDSTRVYTKVTFTRPTGNGIEAEEVTYLVYTTWGDLKNAITYYDSSNNVYLNNGEAITLDQVGSVVTNYKNGTNVADSELTAVLGLKSRRVSRLHNMFEDKYENTTDTAETSYAPEYNDHANDSDDLHEHSEVIVWLGNNGKLTLPVASGIKITKNVTELADGANANEIFTIYARLDMSAQDIGDIIVTDTNGDALVANKYAVSADGGNVLVTLYLADGESAVIMGAPAGTDFSVTEAEHTKYECTYTGAIVTVAGTIVESVVTNSPILPGGLYITKEVEHAFGGEVFPKDYEFEFEVTFEDADGNPIANTTFQLENNYDEDLTELTTDANGVMNGKLRHGETVYIKGIPAGATVAVEEVNIPANYTKTEYRSRNHSGADADSDGIVTIDADQNATVVVINTYTPDKLGVDIEFSGTKNFDATQMDVDSKFTFKLQEYKNNQWIDVEGKTVTVTKGENASEAFAFTPLDLEFDKPGVHSYQIIEVKGDNTDITYDRSVYNFTVEIVIDGNGDLQAKVVGHNVDVSGDNASGYVVNTVFTNYYHKVATSIAVKKEIDDKANSGKTPAGFVIETYNATVDNGIWTIGSKIRETVTDAQGEALLVRNYDNTDFEQNDSDGDNVVIYHFIIKEKNTQLSGWTYDDTEYRVTVVLTKDATTQEITADFDIVKVTASASTDLNVNGDTATIRFANTYEPNDAEVNLNVTPTVLKDLDGRNLTAGEFTFAIFKNGEADFDANGMLTNIGKAIATGTNDVNGNVIFSKTSLSFSQVGKYEYDIVEGKGTLGGVTYDSTIYDLVVEVADDGSGTLKAEHYFEDSVTKQVTFHNTYTVELVEVVINGNKTLKVKSGTKTLRPGDYTFVLYDESGAEIGRTTNLADGTFKFDVIAYGIDDIGKTYTYTVKEMAPDGTTDGTYNAGGVTWSAQSFTVTVEITDNGDGTIIAAQTGNGKANINFVNEYNSKPVSLVLAGKKNLENRPLTDGEFTFTLYSTDRSFSNLSVVASNITHNANGEFNVDLGTLSEGRHYFVVKENIPDTHAKGIHYSAAEFHITIVVADHGTGEMTYTKTVVNPAIPEVTDAAIEFTNVYSPESGELPLSGRKTYNGGKALEDDVFSVGLYDDAELLQTALIKADGSFVFDNLVFHAADVGETFVYTIKEIIPDGATDNGNGTFTLGNIVYDAGSYTLEVTVKDDNKDGELEIASVLKKGDASVNEITFTNTFVPDAVTYDIQAKKTYEKGLKGNDFDFTLVSADGKTNVNQTKKNDADGNVKFDSITFTDEGVYKFTVKEIDKILGFIRYSVAEYEVTITVVNENGVLRVSDNVQIENTENTDETDLEFVNVYVMDGEDEITIRGTKELTGGRTTVNADEFEFGLYDADGGLIESVKNDADGNIAFTTLKFDETDVPVNGQKQITYTVKEIKGSDIHIAYDETVYTVVVTVKDNDQGGVTATYTVNGVADGLIKFTNVYDYAPKPEYPDSPQTGDTTNLRLWFVLLFVSGGGIFGTTLYGRKRNEEK